MATTGAMGSGLAGQHRYSSTRAITMGLAKLIFLTLPNLPFIKAAPLHSTSLHLFKEKPKDAEDPGLWAYLGTAIALVLLGGLFAGLTIALMGQDEIYLQVIATSGEGSERKNAKRVLKLLKRGKHWVLVTLLLANVITNETLPIVLDRSLGGGWPAVVASTGLIVIFGEVVPQSVCVRFGLPIGAWCAPAVFGLMLILAPVAWPTAKLLDHILGEDHGTTYKKAGLKTLVTLHRTLGAHPDERLNQDEVTIISAVLDLKDKPIGDIMTPMADVFTLSADEILDEDMMADILSAGYSRIPIHAPDNTRNFVGMLLVKMLITYDPEDALRVRDFSLATLPETRPETSCLDIVNFFQEGKSHMVLVSDFPGENFGALGVVTLEDVIEELIGEEIIDESDVFIDVHKAIRRMHPAPRSRVPKGEVVENAPPDSHEGLKDIKDGEEHPASRDASQSRSRSRKPSSAEFGNSPRNHTLLMRRKSSDPEGNGQPVSFRSNTNDIKEHLKHLGPSNAANKPKQTRFTQVKIKPGVETIPETHAPQLGRGRTMSAGNGTASAYQGGIGEGLITSAGREASDGVMALHQGYGTLGTSPAASRKSDKQSDFFQKAEDTPKSPKNTEHNQGGPAGLLFNGDATHESPTEAQSTSTLLPSDTGKLVIDNREPSQRRASHSTIGSLKSDFSADPPKKRSTARSGSITESFVEGEGGFKKMVLETTSSSDTEEGQNEHKTQNQSHQDGASGSTGDGAKSKKKRKQRSKKKKNKAGQSSSEAGGDGERAPLLGGGS